MDEFFSNCFKGEQLQAALYAWIEHNNHDLIEQALISPPAEYVDWEDLLRFAVQQNNMPAFDALNLYLKNNFPAVTYSTHLQSAVWDSVVYNIEHVWNQYFDWNPHYTPLNEWRERLYMHSAKHNRLQMLEYLQNHTQVSFNTWRESLVSSIDKGHANIYAYLLKHPVEVTAEFAALDLVKMVTHAQKNVDKLFEVAFEYVSIDDILATSMPHQREPIKMYYETYQQTKAREQKQKLLDRISAPSLNSKRKI